MPIMEGSVNPWKKTDHLVLSSSNLVENELEESFNKNMFVAKC